MLKVYCPVCHRYSELMDPGEEHRGEIIWLCQQPDPDSGEPCGTTNTRTE